VIVIVVMSMTGFLTYSRPERLNPASNTTLHMAMNLCKPNLI
jgi:hypothetical protein